MTAYLRPILFLLLLVLFATNTYALTPVFHTPNSPFPSGQINQKELKQNTEKVISKAWFKIRWRQHSGWVSTDQLISFNHFHHRISLIPRTKVRTEPDWTQSAFYRTPETTSLSAHLITVQSGWALVSLIQQPSKQGWVPLRAVSLVKEDLGYAYIKQTTALQTKDQRIYLTPRTRVLIIKSFKNKFFVKYKKHRGFIAKKHSLSKSDFFLQSPRDKVHNLHFTIKNKTPLFLKPSSAQSSKLRIPPFQSVQITQEAVEMWGLSKVASYHNIGSRVWWKMSSHINEEKTSNKRKIYSSKEISRRKIFSISTSPTQPKLLFASASGVFRSNDGEKWTSIPLFGSDNHPITIAKNGDVFIGNYKSQDHGQTFTPFLRWDKVASAIEKQERSAPSFLKLKKINIIDVEGKKISIQVKSARRTYSLSSKNFGKTWSVLK